MSFASFVAQRYFRARKKTSAVGAITLVAVFGVAVAVFAMFVVLSVFSGLRALNNSYLNTFDPDLTVRPREGKTFPASDALLDTVSAAPGVRAVSRVIEEKVFVRFAGHEAVAILKGVDAVYPEVADVDTALAAGAWLPPEQAAGDSVWHVAGISLAYRLGMASVEQPTPLRVCVPQQQRGALAMDPQALFACADTWTVGVFSHREYDDKYLFVPLSFAQGLLHRTRDEVSALEIRLREGADPEKTAFELSERLGDGLEVKTAAQNKELYYRIMNTENLVLYFVFTLVIAISLFNVGGSVVMLVLDKRDNIRTLWALGAEEKTLKAVFIRSGMWIVGTGTALGLSLAVLVVGLQARYHLVMIEGGMRVPYPVQFSWANVALVLATILTLGYLTARLSVGGMKNFFRHRSL